ncbi:MAG TPA: DUF6209 family protein [Roseiarcus sp.]|nr:DUF6209 family protein [Roseiarcus sp.]
MTKRAFEGLPPRITFTSDFHELVRGHLRPGTDVRLRYDPARIVPPNEDYVFGDPAHRIAAHIVFPPSNDVVSVPLLSRVGVLQDADTSVTGGGSMLTAVVHVPDSATAVVMWFTHDGPYGPTNYDSDLGRNFHFGFPSCQISLLTASVEPGAAGSDRFTATVAAAPDVHRVVLHMRLVDKTESTDHDLKPSGQRGQNGWPVWALDPVDVPKDAVVQFKLYYWLGDIRYKDDNSGEYYLAHRGQAEQVPPPPKALAAAAKAWG